MKWPVSPSDLDLFAPGAREFWFEAYEILHREAPVLRLPGEGTSPGTDGFVLTQYADTPLREGARPEIRAWETRSPVRESGWWRERR